MKKNQNSSVMALAIASVLNNKDFEASRVLELINFADLTSCEDQLRAVLYLTGQMQMPTPQDACRLNNHICVFKSYNIFADRVEYEYDAVDHRIFRTQEEADEYSKTGRYDWNNNSKSSRDTTETHPFLGEWKHKSTSSTTLEVWEDASPVSLVYNDKTGEFEVVE